MSQRILNWPNLVTGTRALICICCIIIGNEDAGKWAVPIFAAFVASFWPLDSVDGYVAKVLNQKSSFGAAFDLAVDRALDCICAVAIVAIEPEYGFVSGLFLLFRIVPNCVFIEMIQSDMTEFSKLKGRYVNRLTVRLTAEVYQGIRALFFGSILFLGGDLHLTAPFLAMSFGYFILAILESGALTLRGNNG